MKVKPTALLFLFFQTLSIKINLHPNNYNYFFPLWQWMHWYKLYIYILFLSQSSASSPVPVPVFYLSHPADGVVTLGCPGARPNMVVGWDQGSKPIYRSENTSSGSFYPRITIDTGHHLVFNPAKSRDSGTPVNTQVSPGATSVSHIGNHFILELKWNL